MLILAPCCKRDATLLQPYVYLLYVLLVCCAVGLVSSHGSIPVVSLGISEVLTVEEARSRGDALAIEASTAV